MKNSDSISILEFTLTRGPIIVVMIFSLVFGIIQASQYPESNIYLIILSFAIYLVSLVVWAIYGNERHPKTFLVFMLIIPLVVIYEPWRPYGAIVMMVVGGFFASWSRRHA